jgi:hypothetical protein
VAKAPPIATGRLLSLRLFSTPLKTRVTSLDRLSSGSTAFNTCSLACSGSEGIMNVGAGPWSFVTPCCSRVNSPNLSVIQSVNAELLSMSARSALTFKLLTGNLSSSVSLDCYLLVINRQLLDRRCGVVHNHQLEVFDFFIKASRLPLPRLCTDNKRNAGRNCASLQRGNKSPSA